MGDENAILTYYQAIRDGSEEVGKWIRLLYEMILDGLQDKSWFYDSVRAWNAIRFMQRYCHHNKGPLAPQRIVFDLWQRASLSLIFGIVDGDGKRQWTEVLWEIGRKMGKSLISGGIGNYFAYAAGEFGSEIYYLAPKIDQADLCFSAFEFNVNAEPELLKRTKSTKYRGLVIAETNTTVKKLPFSDRKSDGYNPMFYCADEVASWVGERGLKQWEVMVSGTGAREEPLGLAISSGGYVTGGIFDEFEKRGTAVLKGTSREKHFLPIMYKIDDPEKWDDINELRKSLPGLGKNVKVKFILDQIDIARESISKKNEFLTKFCNLKQNASTAWFDAKLVSGMFGNHYTLEDYRGTYCLCGLDLSQTTDLSSSCAVIQRDGILWVFSHFWLPGEKLQEATDRDGIPYEAMIRRGFLSLSGDNFVDYHDVYQWFVDLIEKYQIYPLQIGYDRYSSQYLCQELSQYGFHVESVFQGFNLSGIEDNLEGLMRNGQIKCADDNDLLKIHFMDAAQQMESNTSVHPRKKLVKISKNAHVDGVAAILDALCMRQNHWTELGEQLKNERMDDD